MTEDKSAKHAGHGWGGAELVMCLDGPRAGYWYTLAFWTQARSAAIHGRETPHTGRTLGYVRTNAREPHRLNPAVLGRVLAWSPDTAAAAIASAS